MKHIITLESIQNAAKRIEPYIHRTPILTNASINSVTGCNIFFKCENFQKAGAFKSRGACNGVFSLSENEIRSGVCTHSSGNHAQALARAAKMRNIPAWIVMPENAPNVKVEAVRSYDGVITFCKPTLEDRENTLKKVIKKTGAKEIHPYNDYTTITGQATCALEIMQEDQNFDIIMTPVGGGGLLSGTAITTKNIAPETKVFAAEPRGADDALRSFYGQKFVPSINPKTIADGLLTSLGSITFPIILDLVDEIIPVQEESIIKAMRLIWERMKLVVEPSAAVPLAAILENKEFFKEKKTGVILSGGNVDLNNLPWI